MARTRKMPEDEKPVVVPGLPAGWEVRSYTNARGKQNFAVYVRGERLSYGIGSPEGAVHAAERVTGQAVRPERAA